MLLIVEKVDYLWIEVSDRFSSFNQDVYRTINCGRSIAHNAVSAINVL